MHEPAEKALNHLLLALAFFTRVPMPSGLSRRISSDDTLSEAAAVFPLSGLAIAIIPAFIWYVSGMFLPATVSAGLAILSAILITGGLHEDGLADCADGLGATGDRERALDIMRDSLIGTYGALALIVTVGLRWAALASLPPMVGVAALLIAHSGSRAAITIAMQTSRYARPQGLGAQAENIPPYGFLTAMLLAMVMALFLGSFAGLTSLLAGFAAAWGFLKFLEHRLGGYTGDGLGAMQQVCEITIFICLAGFWA